MTDTKSKTRVDKWIWHARFVKTRALAANLVAAGHVRVNGTKIAKPAHGVVTGDVLTFPQAKRVRVVRVLAIGTRRGPASEAQTLYEDLSEPEKPVPPVPRFEGKGRPTGKDRRNLDLNRSRTLD